MSRSYLASDIINSLKRRALLSAAGTTPFSDADWLALMDEEIRSYIWPLLREVHEDYFVRSLDVTLDAGSPSTYRLPRRVGGESLKAVLYDTGAGSFAKLSRLQPEEQGRNATGFWVQDDVLYMSPTPTPARSLRILYHLRPSQVVASTRAAVFSVTTGASVAFTPPATWTPTDGSQVDLVSGVPGLRALQMDLWLGEADPGPPYKADLSVVQGGTVIASSLISEYVGLGAYICPADETPVPNIPLECFPLLSQQLAMLALEGRAGYAEAKARRDELAEQTRAIFGNRIEGNDEVVQNYSAPGWGRRGRMVLP